LWSSRGSLPAGHQEKGFGVHQRKEIIHRKGHDDIYRLHISRSYTAFYKIYKNEARRQACRDRKYDRMGAV
jgi:hypothetical protein